MNTANDLIDFADTVVVNAGRCIRAKDVCGNGTLNGTSPTTANTRVTNAESALDNILSALAGAIFSTGKGTQTTLPTSGVHNVTAGTAFNARRPPQSGTS